MPIIAEVINHDELYQSVIDSGITPIIVNDLPCTTEADKEYIKELTVTQLTSDTISIVPTCGGTCNATRGKHALGKVCHVCGSTVRSNIEESARSLLWMRAPQGVDRLVSPIAWKLLSSYFTKNNHDAIAYLTDSAYAPTSRTPLEIDKLSRRGHQRDLNYFVANFDQIIQDLIDIYPEKPQKPYRDLLWWLDENRDKIFTKYQPLPSKNLFITDKTIVGIYIEESISGQLDTIYHIVSIDRDFYDKSPRVVVNRTARVLAKQASFYHDYICSNFQPKPAHYRRHIYGTRCNWAGRGVITSETGDHRHDEVGIPWRIAVPMFSHHLVGELMRYGYNQNEALGYVLRHVAVYDKLIHRFLDKIFSEFPGGRGPVMILHRNSFFIVYSIRYSIKMTRVSLYRNVVVS